MIKKKTGGMRNMKKEWTIEELDKLIELHEREKSVLRNELGLMRRQYSTDMPHEDQDGRFSKENELDEVLKEIKKLRKEKELLQRNLENKNIEKNRLTPTHEIDRIINENKEDIVNHPKHYQLGDLGIEALDIIKYITKDLPGDQAYMLGNVLKYIIRAQEKNGDQDYLKAEFYYREFLQLRKLK